jgi:hypothetical protein
MSAALAKPSLNALLERFGGVVRRLSDVAEGELARTGSSGMHAWCTGLAPLDRALAEGGLPLGVSVLSSPRGVGGAGEVAVRALAQLQASRPCLTAWVDPSQSLFAPGLLRRGVDLSRLVVVRPSSENRAMAALELVASGAFAAVVVDLDDPWGGATSEPAPALAGEHEAEARAALRRALAQEERLLRRLTEASKKAGTAVLLLADSARRRSAPLPAALRLTCTMPSLHTLVVHIDHDRRGAPPQRVTVPLTLGPGVARARASTVAVAEVTASRVAYSS